MGTRWEAVRCKAERGEEWGGLVDEEGEEEEDAFMAVAAPFS